MTGDIFYCKNLVQFHTSFKLLQNDWDISFAVQHKIKVPTY